MAAYDSAEYEWNLAIKHATDLAPTMNTVPYLHTDESSSAPGQDYAAISKKHECRTNHGLHYNKKLRNLEMHRLKIHRPLRPRVRTE